ARQVFVIGWTGMRGVIALAAAISLPVTLASNKGFPQRNLIIFLTFSVILVTLVLQGLTLPALIRFLGLAGAGGPMHEEEEARRVMLTAALKRLEETREADPEGFSEVYDDLEQHYKHRLATLAEDSDQGGDSQKFYTRFRDLSLDLLQVERETVIRLRNQGRIGDAAMRRLERELDLNTARLRARAGD
ncbi:MAG TPA: cation:proton antiporter, partial [Terriglobia bacterium]|nr:cation:proton antiporter [Terriglobia bacterium]